MATSDSLRNANNTCLMFKNLLLPHRYKRFGAVLLAADLLLFLVLIPLGKISLGVETARTATITLEILFLAAFGLVALSRERIEDEYIAALRSQTVAWVVYACFAVGILWGMAYYASLIAGVEWHRETLFRLYFWFDQFVDLRLAVLAYVMLFNLRLWLQRHRSADKEQRI